VTDRSEEQTAQCSNSGPYDFISICLVCVTSLSMTKHEAFKV